jgi:hypothetical protein
MNQYHITSIDPGNSKMFNCITFNDKYEDAYCISKGYYNEISHITRNTRKINKWITDNVEVRNCYERLSEGNLKGGSIEPYLKYISEQAKSWDVLWDFEFEDRIAALKYDTFLHQKMAVAKICREIRAKNKTKKPSLIVFGKGNGSTTISNTRNSSSHGPIKRIAHALSLLVPVLLVDENNTYKKCNRCNSPLVFRKMHRREKLRKIMTQQLNFKLDTYADYRRFVDVPEVKALIQEYQVARNVEVYKMCYCSKHRHTNLQGIRKHILWQRDPNSAKCILKVAVGKVTGKPLAAFQSKTFIKAFHRKSL